LIDTVKNKLEQMDGRILQFQRTITSKINRISWAATSNDVCSGKQRSCHSCSNIATHYNNSLARHAAGLHATLSPSPKNLYALWQEWYFGIDGRKPAKDFSSRESGGKQKVTYCNHKKFWLLAEHLVCSGCSADDACKKIYDAYGHDSTATSILRRIGKDKENGTIPQSLQ
jgi:hypothetical protein